MDNQEKYAPPKSGKADKAHMVVRALLQTIPIVGGAGAEFFNAIINPPLDRRRQEWMEDIAEGIQALSEKKGINLDDLASTEVFITTLMQASQAAVRNHQQEKIESLRNAVLNAALPDSLDESLQQMFLNFVDIFTTRHIRLLKYADNPVAYAQAKGMTFDNSLPEMQSGILGKIFPELNVEREFYNQVWKDLYSRGLVSTDALYVLESGSWSMASRTTPLGKQFIAFISNPK